MIIDTKGNPVLERCLTEYNQLPPDERLMMSHFELAEATDLHNSEAWLLFLSDPDVKRSRQQEISVYKESQTNKLIDRITENDKSAGMAQLIGTLTKEDNKDKDRDGSICIYSYVPLNDRQKLASNVNELDHDIFQDGDDNA